MQKTFTRDSFPQEIRHVSEAVINLYAAHVNSYLYPYDHPLVSDSLRNSLNCLQKAFQKKSTITLTMNDDGVRVDGESLGVDVPIFRNFALWMRNNQIHALSLSSELTRRELISFHKLISLKRYAHEELLKAMLEKSVVSIVVRQDSTVSPEVPVHDHSETGPVQELIPGYESTMLSEDNDGSSFFASPVDAEKGLWGEWGSGSESRVLRIEEPGSAPANDSPSSLSAATADNADGQADIYLRLIESLLERAPAEHETETLRNADPLYLAHLLNTVLFDAPHQNILARIAEACFGRQSELQSRDAEERYLLFIKGLKPALKPAFRTFAGIVDPESITNEEEGAPAGNASEGACTPSAPDAKTAESIQGPYSPHVIRKTANADFVFDFVAEGKAVLHDIELRHEWVPLFHSNHLTKLCDPAVFHNRPAERNDSANRQPFSAAMILESCAGEAVSDAAFSVLLELVKTDCLEGEAYQALVERLTSVIGSYAEKGLFEKVLEVFNALKTQSLQGTHSMEASVMLSRIFSTDRFNAIMVESLRKHGRKNREAAGKLTSALRSSLIPYLLDALSDESDISKRRYMISLLTASRGEVLVHIMRRLRDSRWYVLRNMLFLLRECHGRSHASEVREFLSHEVPLVRLEALRTLLSFQDPAAEPAVLKLLAIDNFQLQKGAVQLAGAYRIREALPYLVSLLREKDIMGKKFLFKRAIIRALGRLGHSSVLNQLLHICRESTLVHKESHDKLKIDIYRTLHHYPIAEIKPFIDYGMQANNKEIVVLSGKLSDRYSRSVERQRR